MRTTSAGEQAVALVVLVNVKVCDAQAADSERQ